MGQDLIRLGGGNAVEARILHVGLRSPFVGLWLIPPDWVCGPLTHPDTNRPHRELPSLFNPWPGVPGKLGVVPRVCALSCRKKAGLGAKIVGHGAKNGMGVLWVDAGRLGVDRTGNRNLLPAGMLSGRRREESVCPTLPYLKLTQRVNPHWLHRRLDRRRMDDVTPDVWI